MKHMFNTLKVTKYKSSSNFDVLWHRGQLNYTRQNVILHKINTVAYVLKASGNGDLNSFNECFCRVIIAIWGVSRLA